MSFEVLLPILVALFLVILTIKTALAWKGDKYLCDNCCFNNENDCKKSERPKALICTAYRKQESKIS